ncbi:tail fiber domain-containing protein [candidate division KSB1 bacterium]|nr:tail fiber domain-containing protein [candidate division KSB1 bacterium]
MSRIQHSVLLLLAIASLSAYGAVPALLNYQGSVTDTAGSVLDTTVSMTFALYDSAVGGAALWSETQPAVAVTSGLFHTLLGSGNPLPDSAFASPDLYLGVQLGANLEATPRQRIVSNGYAFRVNSVNGALGGAITGNLVINGSTTANDRLTVSPGDNDTTFIYSNAALTEGVFLPAGQSCWQSVDVAENCGGGAPITSVDGLTGGTITSDLSVSGRFNSGAASNLNPGTLAMVMGANNRARGLYSTVGGGGGASAADSNAANGNYSVVNGGIRNSATGIESIVGGGRGNSARGTNSTIAGGFYNQASGVSATVGGGGGAAAVDSNHASGGYSVVSGGRRNGASSLYTGVHGGYTNLAQDTLATICGGSDNSATGDTSFVGGGYSNLNAGDCGVITGGYDNGISSAGEFATVGGGISNNANGLSSAVGGGSGNSASGRGATISGGYSNVANDNYATVPGGFGNTASGRYSLAAGKLAIADDDGAFVWCDTTETLNSNGANTFTVRATSGFRFHTGPGTTNGLQVAAGGSTWSSLSDSTKKRNIRLVDSRDMLERVKELPIKRWSYKTQDPSIEHIGPMAQDFWRLFQVGDDSLGISTHDPAGIALAAIQELIKQNEELRTQVKLLADDVRELKAARDREQTMKLSSNVR